MFAIYIYMLIAYYLGLQSTKYLNEVLLYILYHYDIHGRYENIFYRVSIK